MLRAPFLLAHSRATCSLGLLTSWTQQTKSQRSRTYKGDKNSCHPPHQSPERSSLQASQPSFSETHNVLSKSLLGTILLCPATRDCLRQAWPGQRAVLAPGRARTLGASVNCPNTAWTPTRPLPPQQATSHNLALMAQFPQRKPLKTYKEGCPPHQWPFQQRRRHRQRPCWKGKGKAMGRHFFLCSFTDLAFVFPETHKAEPSLLPTTLLKQGGGKVR